MKLMAIEDVYNEDMSQIIFKRHEIYTSVDDGSISNHVKVIGEDNNVHIIEDYLCLFLKLSK